LTEYGICRNHGKVASVIRAGRPRCPTCGQIVKGWEDPRNIASNSRPIDDKTPPVSLERPPRNIQADLDRAEALGELEALTEAIDQLPREAMETVESRRAIYIHDFCDEHRDELSADHLRTSIHRAQDWLTKAMTVPPILFDVRHWFEVATLKKKEDERLSREKDDLIMEMTKLNGRVRSAKEVIKTAAKIQTERDAAITDARDARVALEAGRQRRLRDEDTIAGLQINVRDLAKANASVETKLSSKEDESEQLSRQTRTLENELSVISNQAQKDHAWMEERLQRALTDPDWSDAIMESGLVIPNGGHVPTQSWKVLCSDGPIRVATLNWSPERVAKATR
jgi:hypothetical protein